MYMLRLLAGLVLGLSAATALVAQPAAPTASPAPAVPSRVQAFSESKSLLEKGDVAAAEAKLITANRFPAKTAQWHFDNATNLLRLAFSAQEKGDAENAKKAAWRALAQVTDAANLAAADDSALLARIASLRATISEKFLGSSTSAEAERRVADAENAKQKHTPNAGAE